jgi:hypothetical protein
MKVYRILGACAAVMLGASFVFASEDAKDHKEWEAKVFSEANQLILEEGWAGLSPVSPIKARWELKRTADGWVGAGDFAVGGHFGKRQTATDHVKVRVPAKVWEACVRELKGLPQKPGPYNGKLFYTDSYPSYRITVRSSRGDWSIFTESQGEDHLPWALEARGATWVVDHSGPAKAWRLLEPHLAKDRLKKLTDQVAGSPRSPAF